MLIDRDELDNKKNSKIKKLVIIAIVIFSIISMGLGAAIYYTMRNPNEISLTIDGKKVGGLLEYLDIQKDEQGETKIYIPIREFASYLNKINPEIKYTDFGGDYETKSEDINKCYIEREKSEVTMFSNNSKKIYKKSLEDEKSEYQVYTIEEDVFLNKNNTLYVSQEGIEKGYNVYFYYDVNKKKITIYTLDFLIENQNKILETKTYGNYGTVLVDVENFNNEKSIFENKIIVNTEGKKYGLLDVDKDEFTLEPKYDNITYLPETKCFLVKSNGKIGMIDIDGKRKINLEYDEIISMGQESGLYVVKKDKLYGVVDENGKNVLFTQYDQIGIDVSKYSNNEVKNGYLLLDTLIPVKQGNFWALFNKEGKMISKEFKYSEIGCSKTKGTTNTFPLLQIPEKKIIVVKVDSKYGFMDITGNDEIVAFVLDEAYIKVKDGKSGYYMSYSPGAETKEQNIIEYLNSSNKSN